MKGMLRSLLRRVGLELRSISPARLKSSDPLSDLSEEDREIVQAVRPYTMTSDARLAQLILAVKHVCRHRIPGAIVECGVWRGGSMMAAAHALRNCADTSRDLFLYDTYQGMPPPGARDRRRDGESADLLLSREPKGSGIWCEAGLADVRRNLESTSYPTSRLHLIQGLVEDTIPTTAPGEIAVLRLDTDWYESTRHELIHLYPRLQPWGILIIDDYGYWQGARAAVDEYLAQLSYPVFLHRVDDTGRLLVKAETKPGNRGSS